MTVTAARRLYLDNAATSFPKPACVIDAMTEYAVRLGASAGRGAYQEAIDTGHLLTVCRQRINKLFNGQSADHVIFTLNCSDALNLAIKGVLDPKRKNHAICTHTDHKSILRPLRAMQNDGIHRSDARADRFDIGPGGPLKTFAGRSVLTRDSLQ